MKKIIYILLLVLVFTGCSNVSNDEISNEAVPASTEIEDVSTNEDIEEVISQEAITESVEATNVEGKNAEEKNEEEIIETLSDEVVEEVVEPVDYEEIGANEIGHIMVVMYHGIIDNPPYHRTAEDFVKDLQYMYDNGYRLVSMRDYVDNTINIEAGYTPIVLTFDDGLSTTFSLEEVDGELSVVGGTAIGLIEAFCAEHPDFGKAAALYINGWESSVFAGAGTYEERLQWLVDHGYDVGNHTVNHEDLDSLTGEEITYEIGKVDLMIKEALGDYTVDTITYPFGSRPREKAHRALVENGEYEGNAYAYVIGFREGPSAPYRSPMDIRFDAFNCPRVRGSEGENSDLWWYFDYYTIHKDYLYISDGNPDVVAVPEEWEENINYDTIGERELVIY